MSELGRSINVHKWLTINSEIKTFKVPVMNTYTIIRHRNNRIMLTNTHHNLISLQIRQKNTDNIF